MRQLIYASHRKCPSVEADLFAILQQSRHNNVLYGVTGFLWTDQQRFMQVIEGPAASIRETYARIEADERHHHLVVLHDKMVDKREFGEWAMAYRGSADTELEFRSRLNRIMSRAESGTRSMFEQFIAAEIAA